MSGQYWLNIWGFFLGEEELSDRIILEVTGKSSSNWVQLFIPLMEQVQVDQVTSQMLLSCWQTNSVSCPTGFVRTHWMDDCFFGYQCLNGCNPLLLHQVHTLPPNLSVTPEMLCPFLPEDSSLEQELQVCMQGCVFQIFPAFSCALHYSCSTFFYHVPERNYVPAWLRGSGWSPSQCDQWEADIPVCPSVPSSPEPAATACPHSHPGESTLSLWTMDSVIVWFVPGQGLPQM